MSPVETVHSTAPVEALRAYQFESPPPTYTTLLTTAATDDTPSCGGEQAGAVVMPRKVFQISAPVEALSAYSYPSHEPT